MSSWSAAGQCPLTSSTFSRIHLPLVTDVREVLDLALNSDSQGEVTEPTQLAA